MNNLINFQSFSNQADAQAIADKLQNAGITADVAKKAKRGDVFLQVGDYVDDYVLRIAPEDFDKANKILHSVEIDIAGIEPGHPLLALSIDELKDVIAKADEWGADNYAVATTLLKSKGIVFTNEELKQMQQERLTVLSQRKPASTTLIIIGYILALYPFLLIGIQQQNHVPTLFPNVKWLFPGLFSPAIAWSILVARTTLPNGKRIATYNDSSIRHGIFIAAANVFAWVLGLLALLLLPQ